MPAVTTTSLARSAGYSLLELLFCLALIGTITAVATPALLAGVDSSRAHGAARYVASQFQLARTTAAMRSAHVGVRFELVGNTYQYAMYADGNGDGVRNADVRSGVDRCIREPEQLRAQFPGVDFAVLPDLPPVDSSSTPPGSDPIKFGTSNIASFSPIGSASSGTVYLLGRNGTQYAVRVLGETGRVRVLKFDARARRWIPQ